MDNGASSYLRFLNGDNDSFVELVKEYGDGLILFLNSIIRDIHIAEEAANDTLMKLYIKKPQYKNEYSFKTWLYTIGRNKAFDIQRKRSRITEISLDGAYSVPTGENIEQNYLQQEKCSMLRLAVSKLKPEYSQILCLIYFENFDNTEAGKIMKKSSKQIRDLLYRAKNALKRELEKEDAEYDGL